MYIEQLVSGLEGRVLAHRKLLALLLVSDPQHVRAGIEAWLAEREVFHDGQEDPGAVPTEGLALEFALVDELREIAQLTHALDFRAEPGTADRTGAAAG